MKLPFQGSGAEKPSITFGKIPFIFKRNSVFLKFLLYNTFFGEESSQEPRTHTHTQIWIQNLRTLSITPSTHRRS